MMMETKIWAGIKQKMMPAVLALASMAPAALSTNCMNPADNVKKDVFGIIDLTDVGQDYGFLVSHNSTLGSFAIIGGGTANAEIITNNASTQYRYDGDQWAAVAYDASNNIVQTVNGTFSNGRIWNGFKTPLSALGFTNPAAITRIQFYVFQAGSLNATGRTTWSYRPNTQLTASIDPVGTIKRSEPYLLLVDTAGNYQISSRDHSIITAVYKQVGRGEVYIRPDEFVSNASATPDTVNRNTANNAVYNKFSLTAMTMAEIKATLNVRYRVVFANGAQEHLFVFNWVVINDRLSSQDLPQSNPQVSVGSVNDFPANEWSDVASNLTWVMVNGVPQLRIDLAPVGGGNIRTAANDMVAFVADDVPPAGNDPYTSFNVGGLMTFVQATDCLNGSPNTPSERGYLCLTHPVTGQSSFFVARAALGTEVLAESAYFNFANLSATQQFPNSLGSLYVASYDGATGAFKTFLAKNVGQFTDDTSTPAVVEGMLPFLNDPLAPGQ